MRRRGGFVIEQRKHTRILLELPAEIKSSNGVVHKGGTVNISFGGVFFEASNLSDITPGEKCDFSIILTEGVERLSIGFDCEVIHLQKSGIGLKFDAINGADAYNHFKNLMVMNSPDPDKLLEELEVYPGLILQEN
jgi:hypothetical protein